MILNTMKIIFDIFEHINELRIAGGEAFLHPDIVEILLETEKYKRQYERVVVATNGTYVPSINILEAISSFNDDFRVNVDDYGSISKALDAAMNAFDKYNIQTDLRHYNESEQYCGGWIDLGMDFAHKGYTANQLHRTFDACRKNYYIFDGRMYGCCPASAAYELQIQSPPSCDFVDIFENIPAEHLIDKVADLFNKPYLICEYCNGYIVDSGKRIKAAQQMR
jgi:hypothetical protein